MQEILNDEIDYEECLEFATWNLNELLSYIESYHLIERTGRTKLMSLMYSFR